jgi:TPP-dependent pyruvate/acetoin dehydrogenase alpha subunit
LLIGNWCQFGDWYYFGGMDILNAAAVLGYCIDEFRAGSIIISLSSCRINNQSLSTKACYRFVDSEWVEHWALTKQPVRPVCGSERTAKFLVDSNIEPDTGKYGWQIINYGILGSNNYQ